SVDGDVGLIGADVDERGVGGDRLYRRSALEVGELVIAAASRVAGRRDDDDIGDADDAGRRARSKFRRADERERGHVRATDRNVLRVVVVEEAAQGCGAVARGDDHGYG